MLSGRPKPLNWYPSPGIGYTVTRRPDGGMNVIFNDVSPATLAHWREFALEHLLDADSLTRNLYDLRRIHNLTPQAVQYAIEVNSDPAARYIRLAVVVANEQVQQVVDKIAALSTPAGVEMAIFTGMGEAEAWLARPLTQMV